MKKGRVLFCLLVLLSACMLFACEPQKTEQSLSVFLYGEQQLILPDGNENIRWMSADTATVTVSADGVIKGIAPGTADVTATKKDRVIAVFHITVALIDVQKIEIEPVTLELEPGDTAEVKWSLFPADASVYQIQWASGNEDVAIIDEEGQVSAVGEGETDLTITAPSGAKASCHVTVKKPTVYEQLNAEEKGFFDYMVKTFLPAAYNAPALRLRGSYGAAVTGDSFLVSVDIQGTNRLGGTVYKVYMFMRISDEWSSYDMTDYFSRDKAVPSDPAVFDYVKINSALEEYWTNQSMNH